MEEKTRWKLIVGSLVIIGGLFGSNKLLEKRIENVRPIADQQVSENIDLVNQHGYDEAKQYFRNDHIAELNNRVNEYNASIPSTKGGILGAGLLSLAALYPRKKR